MTDIQTFNNPEFGSIRTIEQNGEPWFVGKDAAEALGYSNPQKAIRDHVDDFDKGVNEMDTPGGKQQMPIINESGLYSLIFSSKLEGSQRFKRWVTSEVLPSIRRSGHYMTPAALREAILNPDTVIQLAQQIKAEREKNAQLTAENAKLSAANQAMQPKADYFDRQVAANQLTGLQETADGLRIPRQTFTRWLVERKYLYRDRCGKLVPDPAMNDGLFQLREYDKNGKRISGTQTMVTPKGREAFRLMLIGPKKE